MGITVLGVPYWVSFIIVRGSHYLGVPYSTCCMHQMHCMHLMVQACHRHADACVMIKVVWNHS